VRDVSLTKAESALERARAIFQELGAERDLAKVQEVLMNFDIPM
jgi:hypothetical protein